MHRSRPIREVCDLCHHNSEANMTALLSIEELNRRFAIAGAVQVIAGKGGLPGYA